MRKLFILAIALLINIGAFAQRTVHTVPTDISSYNTNRYTSINNINARTTAAGDTITLSNIATTDTNLVIYTAGVDSGYLTGTDAWGDMGFAERYYINGADSSAVVIGVVALFHGTVNPSSTRTVSFNVWTAGVLSPVSATLGYSGFPNSGIDSVVVPVTHLGIGATTDTAKAFLFPVASALIQSSFFIGYRINYNFNTLAGDTLGLACSQNGHRLNGLMSTTTYVDSILNAEGTADSAIYVTDTIINVQNATMWSDGMWHENYTDNDSLFNDLAIYPIVVIGAATEVKSVTRNGLTFFGNYPNPAVNTTNIKFSLVKNADVTIQVMDMNGRILSTISNHDLSAGEHIVPVNVSGLPSGDYLYVIHTSGGDGIAGKMTVQK